MPAHHLQGINQHANVDNDSRLLQDCQPFFEGFVMFYNFLADPLSYIIEKHGIAFCPPQEKHGAKHRDL